MEGSASSYENLMGNGLNMLGGSLGELLNGNVKLEQKQKDQDNGEQ